MLQAKGVRAHAGQPELAIVNMRGDELTSDVLPVNGYDRYVVRVRGWVPCACMRVGSHCLWYVYPSSFIEVCGKEVPSY